MHLSRASKASRGGGYTSAMPADRAADDSPMGRVYTLVIVCHAAVITLLWWFGRTFSR